MVPDVGAGIYARRGCGACVPIMPSSRAISMLATSPVVDCSIVVASSCPSMNRSPALPITSRTARMAPNRTEQSAPYKSGKRPALSAAPTLTYTSVNRLHRRALFDDAGHWTDARIGLGDDDVRRHSLSRRGRTGPVILFGPPADQESAAVLARLHSGRRAESATQA